MKYQELMQGVLSLAVGGLGLTMLVGRHEAHEALGHDLTGTALLGTAALLLLYQRRLARTRQAERQARDAAADDQARLRAIIENAGEGMITLSSDGIIEAFNPAAEAMFGYSAAEVLGQSVTTLIPPEKRGDHDQGMQLWRATGSSPMLENRAIEMTALHRSGRRFEMELSLSTVHIHDRQLVVGIVRDISERKQAQSQLHIEKERLRIALNAVRDAVITTDTAGLITDVNPAAEALTGWAAEEAWQRPLEQVFHIVESGSQDVAPSPVRFVLSNGQTGGAAVDAILIRRDGREYAIDCSAAGIRDQQGAIIGAVLVFQDVTEQRLLQARMSHEATHDALTGLINRREFERLVLLALEAPPSSKGHALLYLDLDQFKLINDTCGHIAGDELLKQVTTVLQGVLRESDVLARLGGDEFAVLLQHCPVEAASRVAENLRQQVMQHRFDWQGETYATSVSIGLVGFQAGEATLSEVLMAADSACYVSKDKGRNRVHMYEPQDDEFKRRHGEMGWVSRIRRALEESRFCLYVQPIAEVSQVKAEFVHFELLIRMRDEQGELVPPMAFIPAAERYNLMPQIDRWVIRHAFAFLQEAQRAGRTHLRFAINLSGASLNDDSLFGFIIQQFEHYDIPRTWVCFEVTETSAISNLTQASRLIMELRAAGCTFSLDDFGSGMSSFAYLKHLPVDFLKIDGGFVKDMAEDPIDHAMVEAINNIGHVMGIKTIAEFVENERILACLHLLGVNYAQGYGISRPFPLEQLRQQHPALEHTTGHA